MSNQYQQYSSSYSSPQNSNQNQAPSYGHSFNRNLNQNQGYNQSQAYGQPNQNTHGYRQSNQNTHGYRQSNQNTQGYGQSNQNTQGYGQSYNQGGQPQSSVQNQGYGQSQGYGQPLQNYGQPQGYNLSQPSTYGLSSSYTSYQTTQSAYGGGGFQQPSTQVMNTQSYGGTQQPKSSRPDQTVRPMTVKQLTIASRSDADGPYAIDGHDAHVVSIIAQVTSIKEVTTFATIMVHDHSAAFEVRVYIPVGTTVSSDPLDVTESTPESIKTQTWLKAAQQGSWVKIFGSLKSWNNEVYLSAKSISPVTDYNELIMHRFQTIAHHLYCTKGPTKSQMEASILLKKNKPALSDVNTTLYNQPPIYNQMDNPGSLLNNNSQFGGDPIRNCVMNYLNAPSQKGQGAFQAPLLTHVHQTLGPKVSMHELASHLEWLSSEGHVYTGDTPEHFISCTNV